MFTRKLIISLSIAVAALVFGYGVYNMIVSSKKPAERIESGPQVKNVKGLEVKNATTSSNIEITGRLFARQKIEVFSEVGGVLKEESQRFREGNYFAKGTPLIVIDNEEQELNLQAQKSSLMNQITLMLPDLKTDFPKSFEQWEKYLKEFSPSKTLAPLPEPSNEQERYFLSARNVYNLYYSIKSQETRLEKYTIVAPFNGRVSESNITEGTLVRIGQKLGTFFNPASYELEAAVSLQDLEFLQVGNKVELYSKDIEGNWSGVVRRIGSVVDENTQTVSVFIGTSGKGLREGMYLSARIRGKQLEKVVEIPRNLLREGKKIFIIEDGHLAYMDVNTVRFSSDSVLVRGIPDGTEILAEVVIGAYEGMNVKTY